MRCEYRGDPAVEIGDSFAATHLYRIAQEAITNAIKHGHAQAVAVSLERVDGRLRLTVRDDGIGIPEPAQRHPGMGLRIMAHRAAVMGGTFEARSMIPRGTVVMCERASPMTGTAPTRVFVVDDHPLVRESLTGLIERQPDLCVCGEAASAASALARIGAAKADVAIVDLSARRAGRVRPDP